MFLGTVLPHSCGDITMKSLLRKAALVALVLIGTGGCDAGSLGLENPDGTSGSQIGGSPGPYWSRNDGQRTAYLSLSGGTAKACAGGEETLGTFSSSKPSMTFVIQGERIEFPLEFRNSSNVRTTASDATSLLV